MQTINHKTIEEIALKLNIDKASVYAIFSVESGNRFWSNSEKTKIPMLFERHWFYRQLKAYYKGLYGSVNAKLLIDDVSFTNRDVCYPKPSNKRNLKIDRYGNNQKQYEKLSKSININKEIAHQSASFGFAQIMGFHYKLCGYKSATEMVELWHLSEEEQVSGFVNFLKNYKRGKVLNYLRQKRWAKVAYLYNGSNYKINKYDAKLRNAFNKFNLIENKSIR